MKFVLATEQAGQVSLAALATFVTAEIEHHRRVVWRFLGMSCLDIMRTYCEQVLRYRSVTRCYQLAQGLSLLSVVSAGGFEFQVSVEVCQ